MQVLNLQRMSVQRTRDSRVNWQSVTSSFSMCCKKPLIN